MTFTVPRRDRGILRGEAPLTLQVLDDDFHKLRDGVMEFQVCKQLADEVVDVETGWGDCDWLVNRAFQRRCAVPVP
jgi:hypothetical protein